MVLQVDRNADKESATIGVTDQVYLGVKNSVKEGMLVEAGTSFKLDIVLEKSEFKLNGKAIP